MDTVGHQNSLALAFGVHRGPKDAALALLRQVQDEAHALRILIRAGHHKLDYIAACIGKQRSYVSKLQLGRRAIPDALIGPLCAATGSNLLRQFRDLMERIEADNEKRQLDRLAEQLRGAA